MGSTVCPQSKHKYRPQCPKRTVYGDFSCTDRSRASPVSRRKNDVNCATISDVPFESPVPDFLSLNRGNLKRAEMRDRCAQSLGVWPSYKTHSQNIQRGHRLYEGQGDPVSREPVKWHNRRLSSLHTHTHISTHASQLSLCWRGSRHKNEEWLGDTAPLHPTPAPQPLSPYSGRIRWQAPCIHPTDGAEFHPPPWAPATGPTDGAAIDRTARTLPARCIHPLRKQRAGEVKRDAWIRGAGMGQPQGWAWGGRNASTQLSYAASVWGLGERRHFKALNALLWSRLGGDRLCGEHTRSAAAVFART